MQTNNKKDLATRSSITLFSMFRKSWVEIMMITLQKKKKFSIKGFFSKCDQTRSFLQIWSHLLKKSLMENFIKTSFLVHCNEMVDWFSSNEQKKEIFHNLLTAATIAVKGPSNVSPAMHILKFVHTSC